MGYRYRVAFASVTEVVALPSLYFQLANGLEESLRIQSENAPAVDAVIGLLVSAGGCAQVTQPSGDVALFQPGDTCFTQGTHRVFVDRVPRPEVFPPAPPPPWMTTPRPPSDEDLAEEKDDLRRIELMRRRCIAVRREGGSALDYLDRGGPSQSQAAEAMEAGEQAAQRAERLGRALDAEVARLRKRAPHVVQAWANTHLLACAALGAALAPNALTERHVLREAEAGWRAVLAGEKAWVEENGYFLGDYLRELRKVLGF